MSDLSASTRTYFARSQAMLTPLSTLADGRSTSSTTSPLSSPASVKPRNPRSSRPALTSSPSSQTDTTPTRPPAHPLRLLGGAASPTRSGATAVRPRLPPVDPRPGCPRPTPSAGTRPTRCLTGASVAAVASVNAPHTDPRRPRRAGCRCGPRASCSSASSGCG